MTPIRLTDMSEADWPSTPEEIEAMGARWAALEPLEMIAKEEVELAGWRRRVKEYTIAHMDEDIQGLFE